MEKTDNSGHGDLGLLGYKRQLFRYDTPLEDHTQIATTIWRANRIFGTSQMVVGGENVVVSSCSIVANPDVTCTTPPKAVLTAEGGAHCLTPPPSASRYRFENLFPTPEGERVCPLPTLSWGNREEVWENMLAKEVRYRRHPDMFSRHPDLEPRMRAILLDWMMEVSEVYLVYRETYHIAMNYVDRYLGSQKNIEKSQLQLIGITALHMAGKNEEIYPPKLEQLAYVTDEACTVADVKKMELIMLKGLGWLLQPITAVYWVRLYLQMATMPHFHGSQDSFIFPQFSAHDYNQICRLLDFAMMDVESLKFPCNYLAATAFYLLSWGDCALRLSKLSLADIQPCLIWMSSFKHALGMVAETPLRHNSRIGPEDVHLIQRHTTNMEMFDQVMQSFTYEPMKLPVTVAPTPSASQPLPLFALDLTPPLDEEVGGGDAQPAGTSGQSRPVPNLDASVYDLPTDSSDCEVIEEEDIEEEEAS